jgi:hypothetical protein
MQDLTRNLPVMKKIIVCLFPLFLLVNVTRSQQLTGNSLITGITADGDYHLRSGSSATDFTHPKPASLIENSRKGESDLTSYFQCFAPADEDDLYTLTICGDIPDNNNPERIHVKDEPGHSFLILTKSKIGAARPSVIRVFGFYPHRPASCLIFRNVRGEIMDNSERQYDVSITTAIKAFEFKQVLVRTQQLAGRKYNLNKFNCYDYVIEVFNSLPGIEKLPVTHMKFPSIFGWGGTPCGLYRDLKKLKDEHSSWAPHIQFGNFHAPRSYPEWLLNGHLLTN